MTFRIVADENMPNVEAWFSDTAVSIVRKPGRTLSTLDLKETDALLVRSVTQVTPQLLKNTPVQFVGSATIGTEHIDREYLEHQNIPFEYAPGCNAQSVVDWLLSVLSRMHIDHDVEWWTKRIGVVGVGNVGSKVVQRLRALGCQVFVCDPIKHKEGLLADHIELNDLLRESDIVCFHTPHTMVESFATHQMIGNDELAQMKAGSWLINAGRGPVFQHQAVLNETQRLNVVLDVWPDEPTVPSELLEHVKLASPHVAGYSLEGKFKGTEMLASALFKHFKINAPVKVSVPSGGVIDVSLYQQADIHKWVSEIILTVYDPARDTATMLASVTNGKVESSTFDALRKEYPTRRELFSVQLKNVPEELSSWLIKIGFQSE
jgi:erythronate-4-phosphate dehydrogenase